MAIKEWSVDNFSAWIHTQTRKLQRGEVYAADTNNLRLGPEGEMITRYGQTVEGEIETGDITGLLGIEIAGKNLVFILDDLHQMRAAEVGIDGEGISRILSVSSPIVTDDALSGRLSGVRVNDDVVVFTSEGADHGYWADLSNYPPTLVMFPLGFVRPGNGTTLADIGAGGFLDENSFYYYRITYFRDSTPFMGKASISSDVESIKTTASEAGDDREVRLSTLPAKVLADTGITSMRIWRTEGQGVSDVSNPDALNFFLVVELLITATSHDDTTDDATLITNTAYNKANHDAYDIAPAGIKSVALYNGRTWVTGYGEGIRPSRIESGVPLYWAFPIEEEIIGDKGRIFAVATYREILVLLGSNAIGRLTGLSPANFDVDWVTETEGVIDSFSWKVSGSWLWFVDSSGVYAFSGAEAFYAGEPIAQFFAEAANKPITTAEIFYLPTREVVFYLFHVNQNQHTTVIFHLDEKTWRRIDIGNISQAMAFVTNGQREVFYGWNGGRFIRRYWHGMEVNASLAPIPTADETDSVPTSAAIAWSYKTQKLDFGLRLIEKFGIAAGVLLQDASTVDLDIFADGAKITDRTLVIPANPRDPFDVLVEGSGKQFELEVSGLGVVTIDGLSLEVDI